MEKSKLVFTNSKGIEMKQGTEHNQGVLYCGQKYTCANECQCGNCDGYCGLNNGCPCPDCEYTLSYMLYCTGKMKCRKCHYDLIRLNFNSLHSVTGYNNFSFVCDLCNGKYSKEYSKEYIPIMHCFNCNFDMCPKCAFSFINKEDINNLRGTSSHQDIIKDEGMLYCGNKYTNCGKCICGACDGRCGPSDGCSCPKCDIILGYNIYLQNNLTCKDCGNGKLLIKSILKGIQKENSEYNRGFICDRCEKLYSKEYNVSYHCSSCNYNLCQKCTLGNISTSNLKLPNLPLLTSIKKKNSTEANLNKILYKKIKELEETNNAMTCVICYEKNKSYLFLPCKHLACCEDCGKKVKKCPLCRTKINDSLKIFIS